MSLTKGKFKVSCVRSISEDVIIDDHWRKVPETETADYVLYASQSANEHDASTEHPAYHVSPRTFPPDLTHFLTQIPSTVRRVGVIKLKVQLLRPTPPRLPAHLIYHRPTFPTPRMPLPSVHPRFARPRVPRPLSFSVPLPRCRRLSDDERRLSRHPASSSKSSRRIPSSTQRVRSGIPRDREGD